VFGLDFVADGLDEVGFAEADAAVDVEGVVAGAGLFGDAATGGEDKVVVVADDEVIEDVFGVEVGGVVLDGGGFGGEGGGEVNGGVFAAFGDFFGVAGAGDDVLDELGGEVGGFEGVADGGGVFAFELADDEFVGGAEDEAAVFSADELELAEKGFESQRVSAGF